VASDELGDDASTLDEAQTESSGGFGGGGAGVLTQASPEQAVHGGFDQAMNMDGESVSLFGGGSGKGSLVDVKGGALPPSRPETKDYKFTKASLDQVVQLLAEEANLEFISELGQSPAHARLVTFSFRSVSPLTALKRLAKHYRFGLRHEEAIWVIGGEANSPREGFATQSGLSSGWSGNTATHERGLFGPVVREGAEEGGGGTAALDFDAGLGVATEDGEDALLPDDLFGGGVSHETSPARVEALADEGSELFDAALDLLSTASNPSSSEALDDGGDALLSAPEELPVQDVEVEIERPLEEPPSSLDVETPPLEVPELGDAVADDRLPSLSQSDATLLSSGGDAADLLQPVSDPVDDADVSSANVATLDSVAEAVEGLRPVKRVAPRYPRALKSAGKEGKVTLSLTVDEKGQVASAKVVSATHPAFEDAALKAARQWEFKPAIKEGRAVKSTIRLPMVFRLGR
jgi:protein TonB